MSATDVAGLMVEDDFVFKPPAFHSQVFYELKDVLVVSEIQILKRLGFNMQVSLPPPAEGECAKD